MIDTPKENEALITELQSRLEIIHKKEADLPDMIAGIFSTEPYRANVRAFCKALEVYIESLSDSEDEAEFEKPLQQNIYTCADYSSPWLDDVETADNLDNLCSQSDPDNFWGGESNGHLRQQCLECFLSDFGVTVDASALTESTTGVREVAKAVYLIAQKLAYILRECRIANLTPSEAFQRIFGSVRFVYSSDLNTGLTQDQDISIPVSLFDTIRDTEAVDNQRDLQLLITHELGHVFQHYLPTYGPGEAFICYDTTLTPRLISDRNMCSGELIEIPDGTVKALVQFVVETGSYWNPQAGIYSARYTGYAVDRTTLEAWFQNETREINPNPSEGFSDTFAIFMRYDRNKLSEILRYDSRVDFIASRICDWLNYIFNNQ